MLSDTVVIEGEVSLVSQIDGDPSLLSEVDGDPDVVIAEGGGIVPSGTIEITENGTYNVTEYASADVDVQGGITPTGTKQITANGTGIDVYNYQYADVAVPNSYSASDEGKVVSNGALVAQTSDTVTANDTYDTTLIDELTVNVPTGGGGYSLDEIAERDFTDTDVVLPNATIIYPFTFFGVTSLRTLSAPNVTNFKTESTNDGGSVFRGCTNLKTVNFPLLSNPGSGGSQFSGCTSLESIHFPKMAVPGSGMFQNCTALKTVVFGGTATSNFNSTAFSGCTNLEAADFSGGNRIYTNEFLNASSLEILILRKTSAIVTLNNINALSGTPFASGKSGGTLYVPQALISGYESATNWSTILGYANNQILPIEGSQYENYYADGMAIPTT